MNLMSVTESELGKEFGPRGVELEKRLGILDVEHLQVAADFTEKARQYLAWSNFDEDAGSLFHQLAHRTRPQDRVYDLIDQKLLHPLPVGWIVFRADVGHDRHGCRSGSDAGECLPH